MAAAGTRDISFYIGDDYTHVLNFEDSSCLPIDISGRTYAAQIRKIKTQAIPDATFTCTVTNGPAGELTIFLTDIQTSVLVADGYFWDLKENVGALKTTILAGKCTVLQSTTV